MSQRSRRPRPNFPASPDAPGTLLQALHDMGAGRRPLPTGSGAKRHHYIAQMLLREFLDPAQPKPRLWQLDKQTGAIPPQTTEPAASVRRLYELRGEDGERHDHLEAFFSLVEDHAAASLKRLHADPTALDDGDRANISLLLALQDARTPAGHQRVVEQLDALTPNASNLGRERPRPMRDAARGSA